MDSHHLKLALLCASYGVKVFPCREKNGTNRNNRGELPKEKSPYTINGFHDATTDEDTIRKWWKRWPNAIVGMPCRDNNIIVLDADRHSIITDGVEVIHKLFFDNWIDRSNVHCVTTPTANGEHYIFQRPSALGDTEGKLANGIDVKDNGYIIAAGSQMADGRAYTLQAGTVEQLAQAIGHKTLAVLPDVFARMIEKPLCLPPTAPRTTKIFTVHPSTSPIQNSAGQSEYVQSAIRGEAEKLAGTPEGRRNSQLCTSAFSLGTLVESEGLSREDARAALRCACEQNGLICGGGDSEFTSTFERCFNDGVARPREPIAERDARLMAAVTLKGSPSGSADVDEWPEPTPLPSSLLPVAPFDADYLPETLRAWVMDTVEPMQCPLDYVAVSALVSISSIIGRQIGIKPQEKTDWLVTPNLWGMIVGRPGVLKSPAMEEAIAPVKMLEAVAKEEHNKALSEYKKTSEEYNLRKEIAKKGARKTLENSIHAELSELNALKEPTEPARKRYIVTDTTYEALGEILSNNPNGVLAYRDELVTLLKALDREENTAARGFFMTGWNGSDGYTFDRVVRGRTDIEALCISMIGSTQPGRLSAYIGKAVRGGEGDDGLIQRFNLLVWPDQQGEWKLVDRYPDTAARQKAFDTFKRLSCISTGGGIMPEFDAHKTRNFLRYSGEAQECFNDWRSQFEKPLRADEFHPALESHFAKYRSLLPSLALIYHLCDSTESRVSLNAVTKAIKFVSYLETHAKRAYCAGMRTDFDTAREIVKHIKKGELLDGFTLRDIHQNGWAALTDRERVEKGLETLIEYDWLRTRKENTGGRPSMKHYINPRISKVW